MSTTRRSSQTALDLMSSSPCLMGAWPSRPLPRSSSSQASGLDGSPQQAAIANRMWCRHRSGTTRISARSTSGVTTSRPPRSTETFSSTDGRRSSSTISCRPTRGRHACSRSAATRRLFRPAARGSGQDSGGLHPHLPREDQQLRHRLRPFDYSPVTLSDKTKPPPIFRSSSDSPTPNL